MKLPLTALAALALTATAFTVEALGPNFEADVAPTASSSSAAQTGDYHFPVPTTGIFASLYQQAMASLSASAAAAAAAAASASATATAVPTPDLGPTSPVVPSSTASSSSSSSLASTSGLTSGSTASSGSTSDAAETVPLWYGLVLALMLGARLV